MRRPLTQEEKEAQKHWERITEIFARRQGPLETPARILSFDELWEINHTRPHTYVWCELLDTNEVKACELQSTISYDKNIVSVFIGGFYSLLRKNYGIKYQCWTSYPIDEQRKEIKWE